MLKTLSAYVKEFKRDSILTPLCMIAEVILEMMIPLLMASIIDDGVDKGDMKHICLIGGLMVIIALGGFVAGAAYMMQMPLFIILVGLIYLVEVLSVIMQVTYFKATHGKRIFKMAPIHHHFELCGWSETRVVAVFTIVTTIMCLIALMAL